MMVYEERYGDRVTCPHCEAKGAPFESISISEGTYDQVPYQAGTCPRCREQVHYKRVRDLDQITSLWLADATGEPIRRYVIFPAATGRRVLWRMFVEDPLHSFLARQGYYDRHLQVVFTTRKTPKNQTQRPSTR
ncbi:hypothetical protein OS242_08480 [Tumebacillus sp. DT12]|uniref:Uncharacterized protein n=1 Tax=Tumebacillus lacus TaxID=2995335 RepID=A0ABT3WZB3_9BACL|nr:hypothetical protein [Tumebacillus lacus]MCX7569999.1 hypothetical protein [Tumebacillus lacus]